MIPNIFLSLSGTDIEFAEKLHSVLPHGLARIYSRTFQNGESLISEMEGGVEESTIFVFLASKKSISSFWVNFELDLARVKLIEKRIKLLVFPIENGINFKDYPDWMSGLWISPQVLNPHDIARYVQEILFSDEFLGLGIYTNVIGRGALLDKTTRQFLAITTETAQNPNVFLFSGTHQIGRRTFAKHVFKHLFPARKTLNTGPQIDLPQFADIADIYRGLLNKVQFQASKEDIERNLSFFCSMKQDEQISEILSLLSYYGDRDAAVFIYTGSGLFNEDGTTKQWFWPLVESLSSDHRSILCFVSNRRFKENEVIQHRNAMQIYVPALEDSDAAALVTATATTYGIKPFSFNPGLARAIGGHPGIIKAAVRLVVNMGLDLVQRQPQTVYTAQNFILSYNIDRENLKDAQIDALYILSWLPSIRGDLLAKTIYKSGHSESDFISAIDELLLSCLIVVSDDEYAISKELREIFRRKYGFGADSLLDNLGQTLSDAWAEMEQFGRFDANLVDSIVFMHAIAGKGIPSSLRKVVLPSKFADILRTRYNQGRHDRETLSKVVDWGLIILDMSLDSTVKEEIQGIIVQSYVRLGAYEKADELIRSMELSGYRSAPFLKGFRLRREGRLTDSIPVLRQAIHTKKNLRYSVQELATVFNRLGDTVRLQELLDANRDVVTDSAVLLDFEIGLKISEAAFGEAESLISLLEQHYQNDGRSIIRRAQIESQRWSNHKAAFEAVNELVLNTIGDIIRTRRWRAMFAAYAGEDAIALRDIEFLKSKNNQEDIVERLYVHLAIANKNGSEAEIKSRNLDIQIIQNRVLRARALEVYADTSVMGAADKAAIRKQAADLRLAAKALDFEA